MSSVSSWCALSSNVDNNENNENNQDSWSYISNNSHKNNDQFSIIQQSKTQSQSPGTKIFQDKFCIVIQKEIFFFFHIQQ